MGFEAALSAAKASPQDEERLSELARAALAQGNEEIALPLVRAAAKHRNSALLWQWTALLERGADQHELSLSSFANAAALAPRDISIAHGHARVALEAGVPANRLYERVLRLAPGDPDIILGYAAALFAVGQSQAAEHVLAQVLERSPLWIDGHLQLAQLRSMMGKKTEAADSILRGLASQPRQPQLWTAWFRLLTQASRFAELADAVGQAKRHLPLDSELLRYDAIAACELGESERGDRLLAAMTPELRRSLVVFQVRHLLRCARVGEACEAIEAALASEQARHVWPYAAVAWRLAQDPRAKWLENDVGRLVSVMDLNEDLQDLQSLELLLRNLHSGSGEFLDQSVRGGSQTDGPLFTRIDPEIQLLRRRIVKAIERYVRDLPPADASHPLLQHRRDRPIRFAGSWSVFLRGGGYHANHVHPEGWISSALYIRVPARTREEPGNSGWLALGEPDPSLNLRIEPFLEVEPTAGRLVLFPSYMWHGTRSFVSGERLTVAFDVRPPA